MWLSCLQHAVEELINLEVQFNTEIRKCLELTLLSCFRIQVRAETCKICVAGRLKFHTFESHFSPTSPYEAIR